MATDTVGSLGLTSVTDGVWIDTQPISILGMSMTATMSVLRLRDNSLLLYSPLRLTPERHAAIEKLGRVAHLYAPNDFHHLFIGEWATTFSGARLHAPATLSKKRADLQIQRHHGSVLEPDFSGVLDEITIEGFRLHETVLFHQPSRTLLVADLVQNVGRPTQAWAKLYTKALGFYDQVSLSKLIRWTSFSERAATRRSLDRILALPFERLIVGHGAPIVDNPKAALAAAYSWL
jgi:hypothetical protein